MDTLQAIAITTLSGALFLLGAAALLVGWLPVPARYLDNRMARGAVARIAGLVFALALPLVVFLAPSLGRGEAVSAEGTRQHAAAVLEVGRTLQQLAEENLRDRDESREALQRAERRTARWGIRRRRRSRRSAPQGNTGNGPHPREARRKGGESRLESAVGWDREGGHRP